MLDQNFIRVEHKGQTVSIVQHKYKDRIECQEVAIVPQSGAQAIETIIHYSGSLDSLIGTLQLIKEEIENRC
jgi:DNA integrity scanning protein DisA with diadenylate cyclase activity